jgi:hypothetical protein
VFSSAFSAKPRGSKNPKGATMPGRDEAEETWSAEDLPAEFLGEKATAEPKRVVMQTTANFILILSFVVRFRF